MKAVKIKQPVMLLAALWLATVTGCGTQPGLVVSPEAALPAQENSAQFLDRISTQQVVSQNDAFRGLLLLSDGKDQSETFDQRVALLRQRGVIASRWSCRAEKSITRGKLAYMIYQSCNIPGGVILSLTGPSQRYCLRELQYQGFITEGAVYGQVTGMEFVAVLTRADAFLETGKIPEVLSANGSW